MSDKNRLEILVTGTSVVGKTTLVSALVGRRVVRTSGSLLRRDYVKSYEGTSEGGVDIVVWDSPGLEDGQGKQNEYLNELKKKCSNVDVVIYCVDLSATRSYGLSAAEVAPNDLSAVKKLTATFGSNWWKRSVFAMTRANVLESALKVKPDVEKRFNDRLQEWKERIHATLIATGVPREVAYTIPVEPVGHPKKPRLPGREKWLDSLWRIILTSVTTPSTREKSHKTPALRTESTHGEGQNAPDSIEQQYLEATYKRDRSSFNPQAPTAAYKFGQGTVASNKRTSASIAPTSDSMSGKRRVEILVTGAPGVGKSTLVNALVGKRVADTGDPLLRDGPNKVIGHQWTAGEGLEIVVWDSPGIEECSVKECLAQLNQKCRNLTIVIYCIDLSATRSYGLTAADIAPNDLFAIKKLSANFGFSWWERSIFVMTRANVLESALKVKPDFEDKFYDRLQDWEERIYTTLIANGVPKEISFRIPVEPVGHPTKPRLIDLQDWIGELWYIIMKTATPSSPTDLPHLSDMSRVEAGARECNRCCIS